MPIRSEQYGFPAKAGEEAPLLEEYTLPSQEVHAVFPSPKLVPAKVKTFIDFLKEALEGEWWGRAL